MLDKQESLGDRLSQLRVDFKREILKEIDDINYSLHGEDKILPCYCSKCKDEKKKWKIA